MKLKSLVHGSSCLISKTKPPTARHSAAVATDIRKRSSIWCHTDSEQYAFTPGIRQWHERFTSPKYSGDEGPRSLGTDRWLYPRARLDKNPRKHAPASD
jgi:hypothetical protein